MISTIFEITISMSIVIILMLILTPIILKRYSAKWRYFIWLFIAIRLVIPVNVTLPKAPITINQPERDTIVLRTENTDFPLAIMDEEEYKEVGNLSPSSADYAPVMTVAELLTWIWAFGAVFFILYNFVNYWVFIARIKRNGNETELLQADKIASELRLRRKPKVIVCEKVLSPMLIGFLRPVVILPNLDYTESEFRVILKHEFTHYKRHDLWYKFLLIVANGIHWFNPLVYVMLHQANRDLEFSCDDAVVKNEDIEFRKEYSRTILKSMENSNMTNLSVKFSK